MGDFDVGCMKAGIFLTFYWEVMFMVYTFIV